MQTSVHRPIKGFAEEGYGQVHDVFAKNVTERGELGGAVAVYENGKLVVDLWGGRTVRQQTPSSPWQRDTIVLMASVNKGMTAICAHMLADRGLLDYDRPVAFYWPEFAQAGKQDMSVRTLMSGMAALVFPDEVEAGKAYEWGPMIEGLARQPPNWPPNTRGAYHMSTYGHLVGEIIRRITGLSPGTFFRNEIGRPLDIDYWFAVPRSEHGRISEVLSPPRKRAPGDPKVENARRAWRTLPRSDPAFRDDPYTFERERPSANGRGNARAVAKVFTALSLGGTLDGVTLLSPQAIERMTTLQWDAICAVTDQRLRYAMGLILSTPNGPWFGPNPRAFGHHGTSGAVGFADPDRRLSFSYCTSLMSEGPGLGPYCTPLIEALYPATG